MKMFDCLVTALWLLAPCTLRANGGGYFRGGVEASGSLAGFEPQQVQAVRILDEQLTVLFAPADAKVEVRYLMRNETAKSVKVKFGFPVEESFDHNPFIDPGSPEAKANAPRQTPACVAAYQVTAGGKPVKAKFVAENPANAAKDRRLRGISGWMVSEVSFGAGQEIPLSIRFRHLFSKSHEFVSDDYYNSANVFRYRLSTGACWAGPIARGRVELKPAGIDPSELKVLKPVNRFRKQGDRWVWDFENLEPTLADDLEIEAAPVERGYGRTKDGGFEGERVNFVERAGRWSMEHSNYRASASSSLTKDGSIDYEPANINDNEWDSAWAEGKPGPGIGEWLELRPETPKPILAISIAPGYRKSEALFRANARPKNVRVELNAEHSFTADIPDQNEWCRIPVAGYSKPVRVVKLVFEEVWKGSKHEDLCVSGAALEVRLDKKPKISPQR